MREFFISEEYLTDVPNNHIKYKYDTTKELTHEQLVDILVNGNIQYTSLSHKDHPEFTKLRESLSESGFIKIERSWSNGDRVLKPFKLNGKRFKKDDTFYCAGAMRGHLKFFNGLKNEKNI
jgi:hypothetical protein